jgi:hypothetical protein
MKHLQEASGKLMEHVIFALDHSMDLKKDGVDLMSAFAVVAKGNNSTIQVFVGDKPDYGDQMFEKTIKEDNPDFVVYASDSYITSDNIKYDAVLLKAYDRNDSVIYLVGQKFKPKTDDDEFEQIGNPGHLGNIENNFHRDESASPSAKQTKKAWWQIW